LACLAISTGPVVCLIGSIIGAIAMGYGADCASEKLA